MTSSKIALTIHSILLGTKNATHITLSIHCALKMSVITTQQLDKQHTHNTHNARHAMNQFRH
jgi:hypothetical protein